MQSTEATTPNGSTVDPDVAFCHAMLPEVSRTFALSIEMLPPVLREAVRVGYLLCRILDTVEDDPRVDAEARATLFDAFDTALSEAGWAGTRFARLAAAADLGDVPAENRLVRGSDAVFRRWFALGREQRAGMIGPILEMSRGMREYAGKGPLSIPTLAALERYCYFVAGTVGELLTHLFADALGEMPAGVQERAVPFGLALQIVNIVKDAAGDMERGVGYLPEDVLAAYGLTRADLLDPAHRDAALAVVRAVCAAARGHLKTAMDYTALWPADAEVGAAVRLFCLVPLVLAAETLSVVEAGEATLVPGRTPKVSRETVATVIGAASVASRDDAALRALLGRYRVG